MRKWQKLVLASAAAGAMAAPWQSAGAMEGTQRQITADAKGHILTNTAVFSPDGKWIVYDERSDEDGSLFDSPVIKRVNVETKAVETLYTAANGAFVGVVTYHPRLERVVFIHGPENPTPDWTYGGPHREGTIVDTAKPGVGINLDARDITEPFTPGALRGGSHVHVYEPSGDWLSFTYQDHILDKLGTKGTHDFDQRNVGVSVPGVPVTVAADNVRNRNGTTFTFLATRTVNAPKPGSDEINRAYEEGWIGSNGYLKPDGTRQRHALAFLGDTIAANGQKLTEVFVVDLPETVTKAPADGPIEGTAVKRPLPPDGTRQTRVTFTQDRPFPGVQGPRFWVRSSPDGTQLAFLMKDEAGIVQVYTVSPNGGAVRQVTRNSFPVVSTLSWNPQGTAIAYAGDDSVFVTDVASGETSRVAPKDAQQPVLALAVVFSPDGSRIAYQRAVAAGGEVRNQIFVTELKK
jgi:hypothetical protein